MKRILFIFDWDDTIFPTSDLSKYIIDFQNIDLSEYDEFLYDFFKKVSSYGNIMIITNASKQWIYQTLYYLPKTKELITKYRIISARDNAMTSLYSDKYELWKINTYNDYRKFINTYDIIFNVGDSQNEHNALKYLLDNKKITHKTAITYKFMLNPNFTQLQVELYKFMIYIDKFFLEHEF